MELSQLKKSVTEIAKTVGAIVEAVAAATGRDPMQVSALLAGPLPTYDDDLVVAGLDEALDDGGEVGLRELEEGSLDAQVGAQLTILGGFDATRFFDTVERLRPTYFSAVPTIYAMLITQPGLTAEAVASLRFAICGAAPISPDLLDAAERALGEAEGRERKKVREWDEMLRHSQGKNA